MDIDRDLVFLKQRMQEVLKSVGQGVHEVQTAIPTDAELPPAEFACDHHFHMGEVYLVANQARLAIRRLNQALNSYDGKSSYKHFHTTVKLALVEAHSAIDISEWDIALKYLDEVLTEYQNEDRALGLKARVYVRAGEPVKAYEASVAALKSNPDNFEAACYLGLIGFSIAKAENDLELMAKDIENLKHAQRLYPESKELAEIINNCENQYRELVSKTKR